MSTFKTGTWGTCACTLYMYSTCTAKGGDMVVIIIIHSFQIPDCYDSKSMLP